MPPPPPGASQHATSPTGLVVALDLQGDLVHLLQPSLGPAWSQACRRRPGSRLPVAKRGRRNAERDISKIGKNAGTGTRSRKQLLIPEDLSIAARASPDFFVSRPSRNQIRPSQSSWSPTGAERRRIIAQPSEVCCQDRGAIFCTRYAQPDSSRMHRSNGYGQRRAATSQDRQEMRFIIGSARLPAAKQDVNPLEGQRAYGLRTRLP
jgi:hypothetical protein